MQEQQSGESSSTTREDEGRAEDHRGGLVQFAREHPALSVLGAAGIGLFGGVEVAAGVLIGAGVLAALKRTPRHGLRERARSLLDRAPAGLRERARAVMRAARGKYAESGMETHEHVEGDAVTTH